MKTDRRRKTLPIYTREEQRQIVINSIQYVKGDTFTRSDMAPLLGLTNEGAGNLLNAMAEDGELHRFMLKEDSKQCNAFSRPLAKANRIKWRFKTNGELNIVPTNLLGHQGR